MSRRTWIAFAALTIPSLFACGPEIERTTSGSGTGGSGGIDTTSSTGGSGGGTSSSTASGSGGAGGAGGCNPVSTTGNCAHDVYEEGEALNVDCSSCTKEVCTVNAFCCDPQYEWDALCVASAQTICSCT